MIPMSSSCDNITAGPELHLAVNSEETLAHFTTLLQSGIFLHVAQGDSIGELLCSLPGFTQEYISKNVQTIFLNGLPADDLGQQIRGEDGVLAVSGAMPGLAGAIFQKGGVHASLRTTADEVSPAPATDNPACVRLKLFNRIAKDRGAELFSRGCIMQAGALRRFLTYRVRLATNITAITADKNSLSSSQLLELLDAQPYVHLFIRHKA